MKHKAGVFYFHLRREANKAFPNTRLYLVSENIGKINLQNDVLLN